MFHVIILGLYLLRTFRSILKKTTNYTSFYIFLTIYKKGLRLRHYFIFIDVFMVHDDYYSHIQSDTQTDTPKEKKPIKKILVKKKVKTRASEKNITPSTDIQTNELLDNTAKDTQSSDTQESIHLNDVLEKKRKNNFKIVSSSRGKDTLSPAPEKEDITS